MQLGIGSINIGVTSLERAVGFYRDVLGLPLIFSEPAHDYARFRIGGVNFGVIAHDVSNPEAAAFTGRHTGLNLAVADLDAAVTELKARGAVFTMEPTRQPWGAYMAVLSDPDGNLFYLEANGDPA
ncbi:MAG TPA: VOC family protein [Caulobacteraceae bacterium]|jgi:catechol 2,3-dioxygenase-like lactoylglutathione lyase family enzyme|nr:VOC family protein [Caulobacteraceae bacterium]